MFAEKALLSQITEHTMPVRHANSSWYACTRAKCIQFSCKTSFGTKKKKLNILGRSGLCRLQTLLQSAFSCGISIVCVCVWPAWSFLESSKWKCESSCLRLALCTLASRALCWHFWKLAASVQLPTKCRSFPLLTLLFYLWLRIVGMPINTRAGQTCHVFYMANCLLSQLCSHVMIL